MFPQRLYKNPYVFFSFPIEIAAHDTAKVVLHSTRNYGLHITSLDLYRKPRFFEHAIVQNLKSIFQVIYCFIFSVILLLLGFVYSEKLMIYAGIMIGAANANMFTVGYLYDLFPFPEFLQLNASNIGSFWMLGLNVFFHPFAYEVVQAIPINLKRYTLGAKILVVLNVAVMLLHFLPPCYLVLFIITNSLFPLTLLNTLWAIYHATLLFIRGKRIDYLIACLLGILPTMIKACRVRRGWTLYMASGIPMVRPAPLRPASYRVSPSPTSWQPMALLASSMYVSFPTVRWTIALARGGFSSSFRQDFPRALASVRWQK